MAKSYRKPTKIYNIVKTEVVDGSENVTEKTIVATFTDKKVAQEFVNTLDSGVNDWCSYDIESGVASNGFVSVTDIKWDSDDEEDLEDLPKFVCIPNGEINPNEDIEEEISEWLSNTFGFCHDGFNYTIHN